ncbi:conserved Plasmodium protein, unknown function [Plasmodium gallinaceum]|uniref:Uncharacterized protein n=1 Tax=Plasmodium gallinaceum TaxID=5849 RepID=A0A1J1GT23_PLAGA|nr:conserved Plasmodium protein, unknown function [Plasmodium gallinaceum]CRG95438.1 conserved Plasmodium protein, unknown function [Plasmodium gallinaceum]
MNFHLNIFEEIEAILEKCNNETYLKIVKIIDYVVKNYTDTNNEIQKKNVLKKKKNKNNINESNSIKNYFKVLKKESTKITDDNVDQKNDYNSIIKKNSVSIINVFFFYGNFNVVIIIYYVIFKLKLFNSDLFINDNTNNEDYIIYKNKNIIHIMCSKLNSQSLNGINEIINEILATKLNSFKIFILESFDNLNEQYRRIFMNKITKSTNLIFIHSSIYLNDIFLNNCLYIRIAKPNRISFNNYILSMIEKKYKINNFNEKKEYLLNVLKNCNFDLTLILTIIYLIQLNNFPDISKIIKLIVNTNIKKLIKIIHKCIISNNCLFLIRNILYNILETYNFDIHTFLNTLCKNLTSFHKNDDNYKKEIYSLFSEYSYFCSLHDNHICSLENLCSKIILIEKKYVNTLNEKDIMEENNELNINLNMIEYI